MKFSDLPIGTMFTFMTTFTKVSDTEVTEVFLGEVRRRVWPNLNAYVQVVESQEAGNKAIAALGRNIRRAGRLD